MTLDPAEWMTLDRAHLWRPYTSSEDHQRRPLLMVERAEGAWLIDRSGKRVLDASGSWWCNNLGHGHPRLGAALTAQAEKLMHCMFAGATHEPAVLLARDLVAIAPPGLTRVFFSDNGSTSVEVALKMAFQYWQQNGRPQRTLFLSLPGGYHGDTIGTMSVGAIGEFNSVFAPLLFETRTPPAPAGHSGWEPVFDTLLRWLRESGDEIAGVVVEPIVQGAAGMRMYPPALLTALAEAAKEADTFLICDEVFTGMGRTGPLWASEHANITPDLLCTAKGLSGGALPFAATLATERVYQGFAGSQARALMHGHTFFANPLGAAVAREVLSIYRDESILENARPKAARLAAAMQELANLPGVSSPRALGMCAAVDVGEPGYAGTVGWQIAEAAMELGVLLRPLGNTIYLTPPLNIASDDLERLVASVHAATERVLVSHP